MAYLEKQVSSLRIALISSFLKKSSVKEQIAKLWNRGLAELSQRKDHADALASISFWNQ
jgi:hypothetical protein